jgi:hypothetical protein
MKYKLISLGLAILVVIMSVFLFARLNKTQSDAKANEEMQALQTTFVQSYGSKAVIKQMASPEKVYAALWTDENGIGHVSWNIGGVWAIVWSSK